MARVLVAEDEDGTRLSLTYVLRREGYEVEEARDGLEAERSGSAPAVGMRWSSSTSRCPG